MNGLNEDALYHIFAFLRFGDLERLNLTCHSLHETILCYLPWMNQRAKWKSLFEREWLSTNELLETFQTAIVEDIPRLIFALVHNDSPHEPFYRSDVAYHVITKMKRIDCLTKMLNLCKPEGRVIISIIALAFEKGNISMVQHFLSTQSAKDTYASSVPFWTLSACKCETPRGRFSGIKFLCDMVKQLEGDQRSLYQDRMKAIVFQAKDKVILSLYYKELCNITRFFEDSKFPSTTEMCSIIVADWLELFNECTNLSKISYSQYETFLQVTCSNDSIRIFQYVTEHKPPEQKTWIEIIYYALKKRAFKIAELCLKHISLRELECYVREKCQDSLENMVFPLTHEVQNWLISKGITIDPLIPPRPPRRASKESTLLTILKRVQLDKFEARFADLTKTRKYYDALVKTIIQYEITPEMTESLKRCLPLYEKMGLKGIILYRHTSLSEDRALKMGLAHYCMAKRLAQSLGIENVLEDIWKVHQNVN